MKPSRPATISAWRREASALGRRRLQLRLRPITQLDEARSCTGGSGGKKSMALAGAAMRFPSAHAAGRFTSEENDPPGDPAELMSDPGAAPSEPKLEAAQARDRLLADVDPVHAREPRPAAAELDHQRDRFGVALEGRFDAAVGGVAHEARDAAGLGFRARGGSEADPLHAADHAHH